MSERTPKGVLEELEGVRAELLESLTSVERTIKLMKGRGGATPRPALSEVPRERRPRPARARGAISIRQAATEALRRRPNQPMHATQIWAEAQVMGAKTTSPDPLNNVDLALYKAKQAGEPVEKVEGQAKTWVWNAVTKEVVDADNAGGDLPPGDGGSSGAD
jgi:hypothetical protein